MDERLKEARHLIQWAHSRMAAYWGEDGSTLKLDRHYEPELELIRDMYQWLKQEDDDRAKLGYAFRELDRY